MCDFLMSGRVLTSDLSGGFGMKSKEGAITMVESIIVGKDGDLQVLKDKVSLAPKVVPIKFATRDHAEAFVRQHAGKKDFPHRFDGFWCNINQSAEERANFKRNFQPLYIVKRAICEIGNFDGTHVVVSKTDKKVFFVEGKELRLVCSILPSGVVQWESYVDKIVTDRYNQIKSNR